MTRASSPIYELLAFIRTFCLAAGWSVVIQDVARKGFIDYYALILEA